MDRVLLIQRVAQLKDNLGSATLAITADVSHAESENSCRQQDAKQKASQEIRLAWTQHLNGFLVNSTQWLWCII